MSSSSTKREFLALWALPLAVLIAGIVILVEGAGRADREARIGEAEVHATASVTDVREWESGHGRGGTSYRYDASVEFALESGENFTTTLDSEPDPDSYLVGERVPVVYSAANPNEVVAEARRWDFRTTIVWGWILIVASLVLAGLFVWGTLWFHRITSSRARRR